LKKSYPLL